MTPNTGDTGSTDTEDTDDVDAMDDEGGVPFDDDFIDDDQPEESNTERGIGPSYDSGKVLVSRGIDYPTSTPKGMRQLRSFLISTWGGQSLGMLTLPPRPMRGGSSPSLHNWGMALDWRYINPGRGRSSADAAIKYLLAHANELGIQGIHDYTEGKIWKSYGGWRNGTPSRKTGMGQPSTQWLHVERTWASANDTRSIKSIVGSGASGLSSNTTGSTSKSGAVELPQSTIETGDEGVNVAILQTFLRHYSFASFTRSDGKFGTRTFTAVETAQRKFSAEGWYTDKIDGKFGPNSEAAARKLIAKS